MHNKAHKITLCEAAVSWVSWKCNLVKKLYLYLQFRKQARLPSSLWIGCMLSTPTPSPLTLSKFKAKIDALLSTTLKPEMFLCKYKYTHKHDRKYSVNCYTTAYLLNAVQI